MRGRIAALGSAMLVLLAMGIGLAGGSAASTGSGVRAPAVDTSACVPVQKFSIQINNDCFLSQGGHMFFDGQNSSSPAAAPVPHPSFGTNIDAADPNED